MENNTTVSSGNGVSILGLLGIAFIVLKLTGVITWSWLWVLAPFWIPLAIFVLVLLVMGVVLVVAYVLDRW